MSHSMQTAMPGPGGQPGAPVERAAGLWRLAWNRLRHDRTGLSAMAIVLMYFLVLFGSMSGLLAHDWDQEVARGYAPPSLLARVPGEAGNDTVASSGILPLGQTSGSPAAHDASIAQPGQIDYFGVQDPLAAELHAIGLLRAGEQVAQVADKKSSLLLGADKWGHDVLKKTIKGAETSILVGLVSALTAVALGTLLGAVAGYFGGLVDAVCNWFYSVFTAVPYLLLVLAVAAVLQTKGVATIILILGLTGWTGTYRLMRAEYIKHKSREYVLAATAIGAGHARRLLAHILPNVSHVALVQMSVLTVGFIKSEVILSFLGFGVPVGMVSWGSMLNEAQNELIIGKWWQLAAATTAMAVLVTAFSLMADALRDALDPKLK